MRLSPRPFDRACFSPTAFGRIPLRGTSSTAFTGRATGKAPAIRVQNSIQTYNYAGVEPLTAANVFRDCSFRLQSTLPERQACRTLMRQAAMKWRRGVAMGDL